MVAGAYTKAQLEILGHAILAPHPGPSFSPFLLGFWFDSVFFGIMLQMFIRWQQWSASTEHWKVKVLVYYLVLISTFSTSLILAWNMNMFVYHFGKYAEFIDPSWSSWFYLLDNFSRVPVSAFFGIRAWEMCDRSIFLAIILTALLVVSTVGAIGAKVLAPVQLTDVGFEIFTYSWLAAEMISDIITTLVIAYKLVRSRTGWKATDRLIRKLLILTVNTQLPPTLLAIAYMINYSFAKHKTYTAFFVCVPKLYILCLLTVLNAKHTLRLELASETSNRWVPTRSKSPQRAFRSPTPMLVSESAATTYQLFAALPIANKANLFPLQKDNTFALKTQITGRNAQTRSIDGQINVTTETYIHSDSPNDRRKTGTDIWGNADRERGDDKDSVDGLGLGGNGSEVRLTHTLGA